MHYKVPQVFLIMKFWKPLIRTAVPLSRLNYIHSAALIKNLLINVQSLVEGSTN